ncbi:MAG: outer membrane protein [Terriglobales bacterium]
MAFLLALAALLLTSPVMAQTGQTQPEETKLGNYIVSQSVEFGYRFTEFSGTTFPCPPGSEGRNSAGLCEEPSMYNTLVNLHTGPRVLEQSLSMRSPRHEGALFDNLFVSSFGWGGDPNNVARLRLQKYRAYNLTVSYRRDQNFFNYNLLANPLNPPIGPPGTLPATSPSPTAVPGATTVGVLLTPGLQQTYLDTASPHWFSNARRMTDVELSILPQSIVGVRLGYSRVRTEGSSSLSFHMPRGTDVAALNLQNNTTNLYRLGIDFRFLPKTTISYDQFYTHSSIGFHAVDNNQFWTVSGIPVDFGAAWNLAANHPCRTAIVFTAACNLAVFFRRSDQFRTTIATEQLSFQSQPSKRIDLSGRGAYSHAHMDGTYNHVWNGVTGTGRQQDLTSMTKNKRHLASAEAGVTFHLTERIRLLDNFRWFSWRVPTLGVVVTDTWNAGPNNGPVTTPLVFSSSVLIATGRLWKVDQKENEISLEFDLTRFFGVRAGYRYTHRFLLETDETGTITDVDESIGEASDVESAEDRASENIHAGLFGLWIRPSEKFRFIFDGELTSARQETGGGRTGIPAGTTFGLGPLTRITPRHEQQYRIRANYTPRQWAVLAASVNLREASNKLFSDNFDLRNLYGGFNVTFIPNERFTADVGYNYNTFHQRNFICAIQAPNRSFVAGTDVLDPVCPFDINPSTGAPTGLFQTLGRFESINHFLSAAFRFKPVRRVATEIGYSISNSDGAQVFLNPLMVSGSLKNSFHRPLAGVEVELVRNWFAKAGWNYYGYNEKGASGPAFPRDFHANNGTVSLRYAF